MAVAPPFEFRGKCSDFGLVAAATIGRFVLGPRRGRRRDFLSLEEASPSCGEPPNCGKLRAGEFIEPSSLRATLRAVTLRHTLLRQPLFRDRSGLVIPGQERDFIGGEYAANWLAGKLAGDDEGSAWSDRETIFFEIDVYPVYDVFRTHCIVDV